MAQSKRAREPAIAADILRAQRDALATARRMLDNSKVCNCKDCAAVNLRGHAKELARLVVASMEYLGQRSSPRYIAALRVKSESEASVPAYATGNGFAMMPSPVYDAVCKRPKPARTLRAGKARLTVLLQGACS